MKTDKELYKKVKEISAEIKPILPKGYGFSVFFHGPSLLSEEALAKELNTTGEIIERGQEPSNFSAGVNGDFHQILFGATQLIIAIIEQQELTPEEKANLIADVCTDIMAGKPNKIVKYEEEIVRKDNDE